MEDLHKQINMATAGDEGRMTDLEERIAKKQQMLMGFRKQLKEKEHLAEFFEFVLNQKQKTIMKLQNR